MANPEGFSFKVRKEGNVLVFHHGKMATILRGKKAKDFIADTEAADADQQELMARITGNYKRGNERDASTHPRNRA